MAKKIKTLKLIAGLALLTSVMLLSLGLASCDKESQDYQKELDERTEREKEEQRIEDEKRKLYADIQPYISVIAREAGDLCMDTYLCDIDKDLGPHIDKTCEHAQSEYYRQYKLNQTFDHNAIKAKAIKFHKDQHIGL